MEKRCIRFYIAGRVQGVWYRASTQKCAESLQITGWAKNLADGRVEVFACGELHQLNTLAAWLKKGPPMAEVTEVIQTEETYRELNDFIVK